MPILDPSAQYYLCTHYATNFKDSTHDFFIRYLRVAAANLFRNDDTITTSIQFKKDLESSTPIINQIFGTKFSEYDFNNPTIRNYYYHLYKEIKSPTVPKKQKGIYYIYKDIFQIPLFQPYDVYSTVHAWYLTDSPIAILCVNLTQITNPSVLSYINLEIDIMIGSGYTLVLSAIGSCDSKITYEFLKTVANHQFAEIHFNLLHEYKRAVIGIQDTTYVTVNPSNVLSLFKEMKKIFYNNHNYFYLYTQFFNFKEIKDQLKPFKKNMPGFRVFYFSKDITEVFKCGTMSEKLRFCHAKSEKLYQYRPFPYCKTGFTHSSIRILLCNVPLYETSDEINDIRPSLLSKITFGYISKEDFLSSDQFRVHILLDNFDDNHKLTDKYVDFSDIHLIRIDFYVKNTLSLTKTDEHTLLNVEKIGYKILIKFYESKGKFKNESIFAFFKKTKVKKTLVYVAYCYQYLANLRNQSNNFFVHQNQIFTAYLVCMSFMVKKNKEGKGVVYQIETGEGKSCIVQLIAAVLALCYKTVHIASSNIKLANRDYYESYQFYKTLELNSAVLLHYNELPYINFQNLPNDDTNYSKEFYPDEFFGKSLFENSTNMNVSVCGAGDGDGRSARIIYSTFLNFESLYLKLTETYPAYATRYFNDCALLIDEADSMLIDELTNGTILSKPMKTNGKEILKFVYQCYIDKKTTNFVFDEIKKRWPECVDLSLKNVEEMYEDIEVAHSPEFINGKKYSIEKYYKDSKEYKVIIPFDYDNKGILEPNKEFSGFIQQFIAIKETYNGVENILMKDFSMNYLYVSHPIFVKLYKGVCGVTGTIGNKNDKEIMKKHYSLSTKKIPRNEPNRRVEYPVILCNSIKERNKQILNEIICMNKRGIPVLAIFRDLIEISKVLKLLHSHGFKNVNVFNGRNEKIIPDKVAGLLGAISLGTNYCGRGTDIKNPAKPLHVILTYYTSNTRVMGQAIGRTARQGKEGTIRIICLKEQYFMPTEIFNDQSMATAINDFEIKNQKQINFIETINQKRYWIFTPTFFSKENFTSSQLKFLRETKLNINRLKSYNIVYPICISIPSFLLMQAQKIFSLFNCPNCKYTWMLFAQYLREMILQAWSMFIDQADREYYKTDQSESYSDFLNRKSAELMSLLNLYLPNSLPFPPKFFGNLNTDLNQIVKSPVNSISSTFIYIFAFVVNHYQKTILNCYTSKTIAKCVNTNDVSSVRFTIGFKPYSLMNKSGSRISSFKGKNKGNDDDDDDDDDNDKINYIYDPELRYMKRIPLPNGAFKKISISITEKIDGLFDKLFEKIGEIIGGYTGMKFFLRRTIAGCEFGICFDLELEQEDESSIKDFGCLIDKDPLFMFTINVKSLVPILAGILMCGLVYIAIMGKPIIQWIYNLPGQLAKLALTTILEKIKDKIFSEKIEEFYENVFGWLKKMVLKQVDVLNKFAPEYALIAINMLKAFDSIDLSQGLIGNFFEGISFIKMNSKFAGNLASVLLPNDKIVKICLLVIIALALFLANFHYKNRIQHENNAESLTVEKIAKGYDKNQNIDESVEMASKIVSVVQIEDL